MLMTPLRSAAGHGVDGCIVRGGVFALALLAFGSAVSAQAPAAAPPPAPAPASPAAAAPASAEPTFDVFEIRVEGNTVLGRQRVERTVYPFLGPRRTAGDMEAARVALERAYREEGYGTVSVEIPEQRVDRGVVELRVVQGAVSRLRVVGARYFSQERILRAVPALAEGSVPNFPDVTAQLATVNRTAERRVTPLLRPGKAPGTTEVDLQVEDRLPLAGSIELNNRQSQDTTPTRLVASLRYDNVWQREHGVSLQAQVSPEDRREVQVLAASYSIPDAGDTWLLSYIRSNSQVRSSVGGTTVLGKGNIFGLRRVSLIRRDSEFLGTLSLGADYKDLSDRVSSAGADGDAGFTTPLAYLPFSGNLTLLGRDDGGNWQGGVGLLFAVRDLPGSQQEFADKRFRANASFAVLKFDYAQERMLGPLGSVFGKVDGQLTPQPLVSNEQFAAGGVDSVRGYLESAVVGDYGLRASLEWRTRNFAPAEGGWLGLARGHVFLEGAGLWLHEPLPGQDARFGLVGAGLGLRVQGRPHGTLALDAGWALWNQGRTRRGDLRLHASGSFAF